MSISIIVPSERAAFRLIVDLRLSELASVFIGGIMPLFHIVLIENHENDLEHRLVINPRSLVISKSLFYASQS